MTLISYQIGLFAYKRSNNHPLVNPVAIAVIIVAVMMEAIDMPYEKYFQGAQFVHFLLGSATVSLAIPIYRGVKSLRGRVLPLASALGCGALISIASGVGISYFLGAERSVTNAFYTKSVTAPIAMGIAERIGTSPTLTAIFAICTGIIGAIISPYILNALGTKSLWQRGFSIGVAAHGIGASSAFAVSLESGTYASLAMGLHGIMGSMVIPIVFKILN
jgi:putative effector of murein hydrolase